MRDFRSYLAVLLCVLVTAPAGWSQQAGVAQPTTPVPPAYSDSPQVPVAADTGFTSALTRPYRQPEIPPVRLGNSNRLEALIRAGNLYLSLQDAIALALENNLDIESSRYGPQIAQADLLRAEAGGLLRGVPTAVRQGPNSALSQAGIVTGQGGTNTGGAGGGAGTGTDGGVGGTVITQTGVAVPQLDPTLFFGASFGHLSRPQSNTITTGLNAIALDVNSWNFGYQQSFTSGTTVSYGWNNSFVNSNNPFNDLNPNTSPNMQLQLTQRLLQGFGFAVNDRNIRVAKNDLRVSDLTFKLQVMTTVSAVVNLYWDLVSFNENYKVQVKALEVAQKFYEDNKKQVAIGTLAPIEIVRAEARVAEAQQQVTNAETQLLQQETIIKNALSRTGVASPTIASARVVPTDSLRMPSDEALSPVQDLVEMAFRNRPDLEQTKIQLENTNIALAGSRSQLLPSLDLQASFQHNSLAGEVNTLPIRGQPVNRIVDPYFIGGYGTALAQIFRRNFPDYSFGFQLNVPLRNRTAQADYIRDRLTLRQQELSQQRIINDVRVNVQNALTALTQARAQYQAAQKGRILQEQTLDAENKKYQLGASTAFLVVQTQRDLAQAQYQEVNALATYSRARVQLDLQTAQVLERYGVEIEEAKRGVVSRPPAALPTTN